MMSKLIFQFKKNKKKIIIKQFIKSIFKNTKKKYYFSKTKINRPVNIYICKILFLKKFKKRWISNFGLITLVRCYM